MNATLRARLAGEIDDLRDLATAALLVPLVWILAFGWRPGLLIAGYDGASIDLFTVGTMVGTGGDWERLLYRVGWLGGTQMYAALGFAWPMQLAGLLGLSGGTTVVLLNLGVQIAHAFLALRLVQVLAARWKGAPLQLGAAARVLLLTLFAFAPLLGWKLSRSHWPFVLGTAVFEAALVMVLSGLERRLTATLCLLSLGLFTFALGGAVQQGVLNGVVFGLPILAGAAAVRRDRRAFLEAFAVPGLVVLAALGLVAPHLGAMLRHATGDEAARVVGGDPVTYSYMTATARDWWASLPWSLGAVDLGRPLIQHHEANVPFGPALLLLAAVPWKRAKALGVGLAVSALLAMLFAMNVHPVSDALLSAVPLLKSFRVPTRAILPVAMALPAIGLAGVLARWNGLLATGPSIIAAVAAVVALALLRALPPAGAEALLWLGVGAALVLLWKKAAWGRPAMIGLAALLVGGSLLGFGQRLAPFPSLDRIESQLGQGRAAVVRQAPELADPLARAYLQWEDRDVHANTGPLAGLSGPGGYGFPGRRYLELWSAAVGRPYNPTTVNLHAGLVGRALPVLGPLYNVRHAVSAGPSGPTTRPLQPGPGPAWFSSTVTRVRDRAALVALVRERSPDPAMLADELVIPTGDAAAEEALRGWTGDPACRGSRVLEARSPDDQRVVLKVESRARCPLTVATNWAGVLRARVAAPDGAPPQELPIFPGWNALTSMLVPPGTHEIVVEPVLPVPGALRAAQAGGWLLLAAALAFVGWRTASAPLPEPGPAPEKPAGAKESASAPGRKRDRKKTRR